MDSSGMYLGYQAHHPRGSEPAVSTFQDQRDDLGSLLRLQACQGGLETQGSVLPYSQAHLIRLGRGTSSFLPSWGKTSIGPSLTSLKNSPGHSARGSGN